MSSSRTKPGAKGATATRGSGRLSGARGSSGRARGSGRRGSATLSLDEPYLKLSTRPLHVLLFLLPLILFYEAAAAFHLIGAEGVEETIRARRILGDFFRLFDVGGIFLPGILVTVVLLLWHILIKDPWRVRGRVLWMMALEALVWTPPVLVLGQVLYKLMSGSIGAQPPVNAGIEPLLTLGFAAGDAIERSLVSRAAIAVGAGLYEEMLFRMVAIALFHVVLVDLIGMGSRKGTIVSVVLAALAFAFYHDVALPGGGLNWPNAAFFVFAGVYFGLVYVWRGFGVVVAVHALYDLAVLVFLKNPG